MNIKGKNIQLFPLYCHSAFSRELNLKKQLNKHIQSVHESMNQYVVQSMPIGEKKYV